MLKTEQKSLSSSSSSSPLLNEIIDVKKMGSVVMMSETLLAKLEKEYKNQMYCVNGDEYDVSLHNHRSGHFCWEPLTYHSTMEYIFIRLDRKLPKKIDLLKLGEQEPITINIRMKLPIYVFKPQWKIVYVLIIS